MIRVCHIADHMTGKADGIYTQLLMQFRFMDTNRFEQHLILSHPIENIEIYKELGVKIKLLPKLKSKIPLIAFLQTVFFIKKNKIDVLHVHFLKPYIIIGIANLFLRKGAIYNYHGLSFDNLFNSRTESMIYKIFNRFINFVKSYNLIIAPSEESKRRLLVEKRFCIPIESYYVGMDVNILSGRLDSKLEVFFEDLKKDNLIIGMVARIDIAKRIDNAVKIFVELLKEYPGIKLVILGDGNKTDDVLRVIDQMGVSEKVYLLGYVPNARNYIKYFDIFLLTSDYEGFPIAIWEAMLSGVPVVSSDVGGIKEIIDRENCGYTYPVQNLQVAKDSLLELI